MARPPKGGTKQPAKGRKASVINHAVGNRRRGFASSRPHPSKFKHSENLVLTLELFP